MDTREIIKGLKAERKRLDKVITLLSAGTKPASAISRIGKRPSMSKAERLRRSVAAKERWAKRKKAETK